MFDLITILITVWFVVGFCACLVDTHNVSKHRNISLLEFLCTIFVATVMGLITMLMLLDMYGYFRKFGNLVKKIAKYPIIRKKD